MSKVRGILTFAVAEFGPLALFWALNLTFGVKVAIAGAIAAILFDSVWRLSRGRKFTRLYLLTSGLTLVFGAIDLVSTTPFMLKYEAVVTNLALAGAFVYGAFGEKPMLQEVAERREGSLARHAGVSPVLSTLHAGLGYLFRRQGGAVPLPRACLAARRGDGVARGAGRASAWG